jgi:hypothetical protein
MKEQPVEERLEKAVSRAEELLERQRERFGPEYRKAGATPGQGYGSAREHDEAELAD